MFIELSAPPSAPPSAPLYDLVLMPKRSQTEDWVDAIRIFIRDALGNKNWQFKETCFEPIHFYGTKNHIDDCVHSNYDFFQDVTK